MKLNHALIMGALLAAPAAMAQQNDTVTGNNSDGVTTSENLPAPKSDNDPKPPVASPAVPDDAGLVRQAGIGGQTAYGRAGVLELGGFGNFTTNDGNTNLGINPTFGYFFMDNLQISTILGLNFSKVAGQSFTEISALLEPSFHLPFTQSVFGFVGVGAGIAYQEGPGAGFALTPRLGMNVLVGRSGILTPALYYRYLTTDAATTAAGTTLAVNTAFGVNVGYTVMW